MLLDCVNLRYQLMPYIYTAARQAYDTGISICRPLYYDWPEENESYRQEGEYMFGDDILVSPIVTAAGKDQKTFHKTWLPEGAWYDASHNEMVEGSTTVSHYYGLSDIPHFVKAGSVVVCAPPMMNLKKASSSLVVKVYPGSDGEMALYEDAGDTQDYENGAFATTSFSQKRTTSELTLTIAPRQGHYNEMPAERSYQVVFVLEDEPRGVTVNGVPTDDWTYDGQMRQVTVSVPTTDCGQQTVVSLQRNTADITQIGTASIVSQKYYDMQGREYTYAPQGTYILKRIWNNGHVTTHKFIRE